ncbi:MAG: hypothetical protein QOG34_1815 [Frankiaceae bacterium]|jgi:hypothetical protein|nr:hypothetical protein [Frankiaceae bacterium]
MGGHLVHLLRLLQEEMEHGGAWAGVGIVIGLVVGYAAKPIWHASDVCVSTGIGRDVFGHCPNVLDGERVLFVIAAGVVFGLLAIGARHLFAGTQSDK